MSAPSKSLSKLKKDFNLLLIFFFLNMGYCIGFEKEVFNFYIHADAVR